MTDSASKASRERKRRGVEVAALVLALAVTGCPERFDDRGVGILNHSGVTLDFVYVTAEGEDDIGTDVPAGRSYGADPRPMPRDCAVGHIEARLPDDGRVVKRLDPPFCHGATFEVLPGDIPAEARPSD